MNKNKDKMDIELSIIIPAYNAEDKIFECLESITLAYRKYPIDIEVLVIDDGSIDKTFEIVSAQKENYAFINLVHQKNSGVSSARNKGLSLAKGKWIMFIDADDTVEQEYFRVIHKLLREIKEDESIMFSYNYKYFTNTIPFVFNKANLTIEEILRKYDASSYESTICTVWNKVYNLNLIKRNYVKFNEKVKWGEDVIFNLNYFSLISKVNISSVIIYNYTCNNNSSAVNKFYPEFNRYMDEISSKYSELIYDKNIIDYHTNFIMSDFLAQKWLFITESCIKFKKISFLRTWYDQIDYDLLKHISIHHKNNIYNKLATAKLKGHSFGIVVWRLIAVYYIRELKRRLYQFKSRIYDR